MSERTSTDIIRDTLWDLYGYGERTGTHPDTEAAYRDYAARIVSDLDSAGYQIIPDHWICRPDPHMARQRKEEQAK